MAVKSLKRGWIGLFAALFAVVSLFQFSAAAKTDVPYDYVLDRDSKTKIPIPSSHECVGVIKNIEGYVPESGAVGSLNSPKDIFIDKNDNIYIADTNNNAVVKLNQQGKLIEVITQADGVPLKYPLGVYVDDAGDIFVADNGNKRILHLDGKGQYIESFVKPETDMIGQELTVFDPAKIAISSTNGYIYMVLGKQFMTIDARNQFKGLVGAEQVGFDLFDFLFRLFGSQKQKDKIGKRQPVPYNNFHITPDNDIYAVSMSNANQIKKINSIGNNIYPGGFYGEMSYQENGTPIFPFFVDIAINSGGIITVAEQHSSRLYQYDGEGNLLAAFGGKGDNKGRFEVISSIAYDSRDRLYVLDGSRNNIQVLKPTGFLEETQKATVLYQQGKYDDSLKLWNKVNVTASNYPNAKSSIAKIMFKKQDYSRALEEYYQANDKAGYGMTLEKLRFQVYSEHFTQIILIAAAVIFLLIWLLRYLYRKSEKAEEALYHDPGPSKVAAFFSMCLLTLFHPIRMLDLLKRNRDKINLLPVILLPVLTIVVRILSLYFTNFTVATMRVEDANLLFEIAVVIIPYISFSISIYGILSIWSGETKLIECFSAVSYALVPMVFGTPLLTLLSRMIAHGEVSIFYALQSMTYLWTVLLIIAAIYRLNNISVKKTVGVCCLSILGVMVVWVAALLIFALTSQLIYFFTEINLEFNALGK